MSYFYREKPRFGERFRGKSGDELLEELKQEFGEDSPFFETTRTNGGATNGAANRTRDPFERHTSFPRGFPFDDDAGSTGFGRRSDIRAHLDDLAARHPEFADHLLGPPWADVPFTGVNGGSLPRNTSATRNRHQQQQQQQPAHQNGVFHNHTDEDARSQASGGSAASGASAVSSEPDQETEDTGSSSDRKASSGLRNTLDIGQHQHNMENPQQQRNVRSMSAPPENRNNMQDNNQQKFVSRVDINPQAQANQTQPQQGVNQSQAQPPPQQQQTQREKSPAPQTQKQHSNVRQIPIFVEGRDKPVIAKERDETDFTRRQESPPHFTRRQQSPPHFQRPSHFSQSYNRQPPGWGSNFQDPFFEHTGRWTQPPPQPQSTFPQFRHTQEKPKTQQTHNPEFWHQNQQQHKPHTQPQPQPQPQKQPQAEPQPEAPPKPRQQVQPKDPLEKVAMVQKEVDALTEQVKQFTGNSRQDKQYMYLDEMLTRELIKLDDIDTEGKENVRQARKQAIKSIQESISLLESKAPVPGQEPASNEKTEEEQREVKEEEKKVEEKPAEPMETNEESAPAEQKAIPLPPPTSPSKTVEVLEIKTEENTPPSNEVTQPKESNTHEAIPALPQPETPVQNLQQQTPPTAEDIQKTNLQEEQQQQIPEPMDSSSAAAPQVPTNDVEMEIRQPSPAKELPQKPEQPKENPKENNTEVATEKGKSKKEPPPVPAKPGKSPKKAKKTKKQPEPVSETAIPLPAPGQSI